MRYKLAGFMAWPWLHGSRFPSLPANDFSRWVFRKVIFPVAGI